MTRRAAKAQAQPPAAEEVDIEALLREADAADAAARATLPTAGQERAIIAAAEALAGSEEGVPAKSRAVVQLQMVDVCSTVGNVQGTKRHTSKEWILFIESVQASEVARGRRIYVIYIDADSVARGFVLPEKLSEMGIELRVGAGNHHEWVGHIEVLSGDVVQRCAEMMLRCAGRGARWTLVAREHAWFLHAWFLHNFGPQRRVALPEAHGQRVRRVGSGRAWRRRAGMGLNGDVLARREGAWAEGS
jgi:hypothetical protein